MRGLWLSAALLALVLLAQTRSCAYVNGTGIGAQINATAQYVEHVNQSAYLVFYPDLAPAHAALDSAANVSRTNATEALALLATARSNAQMEFERISQYRRASFYAMVAISALMAVMLASLMRKPSTRGRAGGRGRAY